MERTLKFTDMALTKEEKERKDNIFKYILKKTGISYSDFIQTMKNDFVAANLDILTKTEKKRLNVHE